MRGDEFLLVLQGKPAELEELGREANRRAEALHAEVAAAVWDDVVAGLRTTVTTGVAVGILGRRRRTTPRDLLREAEERVYQAKRRRHQAGKHAQVDESR